MERHDLDCSEIDELDEISGDEQQALVWCRTHRRWEWHWIPRDLVRGGSRRGVG
jgi:hypothetical protein